MAGLEHLERVQFRAGDLLFKEDEQSFFFYIIEEGTVEIFLTDPANPHDEIFIATLGPGQPLGEFALIAKKPRSATARAVTACTAVKISEVAYEHLLTELPDWALSLIKSLVERLLLTDEKLRASPANSTITKTEIELILNSAER